jgi:uncharacterized protein
VALETPAAPAAVAKKPISDPRCPPGGPKADYDVCIDPQIRAIDRDLHAAYARAAAGAPAEALQTSEIDWLLNREAAAKRSPGALVKAYRERIAQLDAMAPEAAPH